MCNMRVLAIVFFTLFVAVAFGQTPSTPVWPKYFSASIQTERSDGTTDFFRWFYSEDEDKSRLDGMVEFNGQRFFQERIYDHSAEVEYTVADLKAVIYQMNSAVCFTRKINGTIPVPDTSKLTYLGQSILYYEPVYVWTYTDTTTQITYHYMDSQSTREPMKIDFYSISRKFGESWTFFEFDEAEQDPNLFVIPSEIASTCNPVQ